MNSKLLYFFGGVVAGSAATFFVLRRRMNLRLEEEISDVKEAYSSRKKAENDIFEAISEEETEKTEENPKEIAKRNAERKAELMSASSIMKENGYVETHKTDYNLFSKPPKPSDIHNGIDEGEDLEIEIDPTDDPDILDTTPDLHATGPYVLEDDAYSTAADKMNENPYYDKVTLFYYDDGVLASEEEEIITDIEGTVGYSSLARIGEYEPDVVYVRDDRTSTDYEIIRQYRDFAIFPDEDGA